MRCGLHPLSYKDFWKQHNPVIDFYNNPHISIIIYPSKNDILNVGKPFWNSLNAAFCTVIADGGCTMSASLQAKGQLFRTNLYPNHQTQFTIILMTASYERRIWARFSGETFGGFFIRSSNRRASTPNNIGVSFINRAISSTILFIRGYRPKRK